MKGKEPENGPAWGEGEYLGSIYHFRALWGNLTTNYICTCSGWGGGGASLIIINIYRWINGYVDGHNWVET